MKRAFFVALTLSAAATLAACDNSDDAANTTATPAADGSVTMPSPAPETTTPPAAGSTTGTTGTMGTTGGTGTTGATGTTGTTTTQ